MHSPSFLSLSVCVCLGLFNFVLNSGEELVCIESYPISFIPTQRGRETLLIWTSISSRRGRRLFSFDESGQMELSLSFSFFLFPFKFRHLTDVWIATHAGVSLRAVFDSTTHTHTSSSIEMWNACLWVAKRTNRFFGVMTSFTHYHPTTHPLHPSRRHPGSCRSP